MQPPPIAFRGARWSSDELAAIAAGWLDFVHASVPPSAELTAMLMSNHPQTIALFFALSSLALPVVVFPADARAWRSSPSLPAGTPVFVAPPLRALAQAAEAAGFNTAPVLPVLSHLEGRTQIVTVLPPLPPPLADPADDREACLRAIADVMGDYVRRFPEQCYSLVFGLPADEPVPARTPMRR